MVSAAHTNGNSAHGKRLLFVVSAPSGAGKTSLCTAVIKQVPDLCFSVSHTTRACRPGEQHGRNYYFVSPDEFKASIAAGTMAEWTEIYGNCYGTASQTIQNAFDKGFDILFDIDERGGQQLSRAYPDVVTILVLPPSLDVLKKRLVDRGTEDAASLSSRLHQAQEEIKRMSWYGYVIVNDGFDEAVAELKSIIIAERCRHNHGILEGLLHA
jgi:guanylate kinase